jgi:DNA primase
VAIRAAPLGKWTGRIDTDSLKLAHPIEDVVARYGIELKRQGRGLVGRCPFHADGGRPNLTIFPATRSWFCFRCCLGGDVIKFIMLAEDIGFMEAVGRLRQAGDVALGLLRVVPQQAPRPVSAASGERDADELAVLQAAVTIYHHTLFAEPRALAYLAQRGLDRATIEQCRLGYASGDRLAAYLRWHRLSIGAALRVGLVTHTGAEFLAERIVVPDLCSGRPVWLIGRLLVDTPADDVPVHLGLPGPKPLLGLDQARRSPTVVVVEGSFDWLTLTMWGYPVVATLGTHVRADLVEELRTFQRQFLVLDNDGSGFEATVALQEQLGPTAIPVGLPDRMKDPSQLAAQPDGPQQFAAALLQAVGQLPTDRAEAD